MSGRIVEREALAQLQRVKTSYQRFIKVNYEGRAEDCRTCPVRGVCCTDAHFVNVHITRLEAVAIRDTLERTPRLDHEARRAVYRRARQAVERYDLRSSGDTFRQTYACPLYEPSLGCLVHRRAKPAPCIQHACYEDWEDVPPVSLQQRTEHRVEQLNTEVYGSAWAWLPTPLWLCLVDPDADGAELARLAREWSVRVVKNSTNSDAQASALAYKSGHRRRKSLPLIK
jgi:hypothetical protein